MKSVTQSSTCASAYFHQCRVVLIDFSPLAARRFQLLLRVVPARLLVLLEFCEALLCELGNPGQLTEIP